jgi:hypothetical protein
MSGIISWRGFELDMRPLTPVSADTRRLPICRFAQAELLQTLAPDLVSTSLLEMSPFISALHAYRVEHVDVDLGFGVGEVADEDRLHRVLRADLPDRLGIELPRADRREHFVTCAEFDDARAGLGFLHALLESTGRLLTDRRIAVRGELDDAGGLVRAHVDPRRNPNQDGPVRAACQDCQAEHEGETFRYAVTLEHVCSPDEWLSFTRGCSREDAVSAAYCAKR